MHKEPTKSAKRLPATNCTPAASRTHILTSGIRKSKQCSLKASDETGNFATITKDKHETYQSNVHSLDNKKPGQVPILPYFLCTPCINHTPMSPATKTIKAHVCSATSLTTFPRKLKIAPTTFPTTAGNASTAFPRAF